MTIHLLHKRILVTREKQAAAKFAELINAHHGIAIQIPLLQINCLLLEKEIRNNLMQEQYEWVFFTSKNGVDCLLQQNVSLSGVKIAAVGPKTAKAIEDYGYEVAFMPSIFNAEIMASEFLEIYKDSGKILLVRGKLASNVLIKAFTKSQVNFDCVEVYETKTNLSARANLQDTLSREELDFISFTSPSTIDAFMQLAEEIEGNDEQVIVCIGTTTEKRAKEVGFSNIITAENFTIEGMVDVIHKYLKTKGDL